MEEKRITRDQLHKINDTLFEIKSSFRADMRVPVRVYMNEAMIDDVLADQALWQLVNVSTLPGIQKYALAMPDIHQGYGFPIGGVAATAIDEDGVISPGGIGYDINCGVRFLKSNVTAEDIKPYINKLALDITRSVPSGVGKAGRLSLSMDELNAVLQHGARHMLELGYGQEDDVTLCEEQGAMAVANPSFVSDRAKSRGRNQLGTLGSGNHFLELQVVDTIFDKAAAQAFGLYEGQVTVMIHCGSRGLGHQTCTDYVRSMMSQSIKWGYELPDRELICAPFHSPIAQRYFSAMAASANFAWANRHVIAHWTRKSFNDIVGGSVSLSPVYDVSHNIGKIEHHVVDGVEKKVVVHRKGATRSFGPGHKDIPEAYRHVGQPVLIPGTMGTSSYILAGCSEGMEQSFGSSCHGAGRRMSRSKAKKMIVGKTLRKELEEQGIVIQSFSDAGLAEEAPVAYKDVDNVVSVVHNARLAKKVVRLKPLAVIKG